MTEARKDQVDLSPEQMELLDLIVREESGDGRDMTIPPRPQEADGTPLSFGQQRLWFEAQFSPDRPSYNQTGVLRLDGPVLVGALERALDDVVARHEILRTRFVERQGHPLQIVSPHARRSLVVADLGALAIPARDAVVERLAQQDVGRLFDLSRGPLLRATLLKLDDRRHALVLTLHHIICDGWSVAVLTREVAAVYDAILAGRPSSLPRMPIQYADFAVWQRRILGGRRLEDLLAYWRGRLDGARPTLDLPVDRPRSPKAPFRGAMLGFDLPRDLDVGLQEICRREGVTLFMALLAAFKALLHRYGGQEDIVVSSPVAGRPHASTVDLIGFFVNSLVLRTDLSGDPTVRDALRRVRDACLGAYAHMDLPFERLVEELRPERVPGVQPFAQVSFMVHRDLIGVQDLAGGLKLSLQKMEMGTGELDLSFFVWQGPQGLTGHVVYNSLLFEASTIDRLLGSYRLLLQGMVGGVERRLSELGVLTGEERERVVGGWNATGAEYGWNGSIQEAFERQARERPEAQAVLGWGAGDAPRGLTYGELNRRANVLARRLLALGVGPEERVVVCLERSPEMVLGMLGTLKAGGAYVPVDPQY
ncbi:MAG TPA: condensation domain-containing protein, partial [Candidatus Cryosericum sp.]|nr:condensation domain-containing protein [Candidatus Cryosericum sp.]